MMKSSVKYILGLCAASMTWATATAQADLTKEITIEKDIVPQEREATRLNRIPRLQIPEITAKRLSWSDRAISSPVTPSMTVLPAASYAASIERSPYRGYASLGYFPSLQIGASAGYRFVDTDATSLQGWLQYDGSQYKRECLTPEKISYRDHTATLGLDLGHRFSDIGRLGMHAGYSISGFNFPSLIDKGWDQTANTFNLAADWTSAIDRFNYNIGVDYRYFMFQEPYDKVLEKSLKENAVKLNFGGRYDFNSVSSAGIDVDLSFMGYKNGADLLIHLEQESTDYEILQKDSYSPGVVNVRPYYLMSKPNFDLRLGLEIYSVWTGDWTETRLAPDVRWDWHPGNQFAFYACISGGGGVTNSIDGLFANNHYINPSLLHAPSYGEGKIEGGLIIGPFAGASFEVWGGYESTSGTVMPALIGGYELTSSRPFIQGVYAPVDLEGAHYGVAFNYDYRNIAKLRLSYEGASHGYDKGYSQWLDRAKNVFDASLIITPVEQLDINLGYELRAGRAVYNVDYLSDDIFSGVLYQEVKIGNVNSLNAGIAYRITPQIGVFAQFENILNKQWQLTYGIPSKGVTGLAGLTYKF